MPSSGMNAQHEVITQKTEALAVKVELAQLQSDVASACDELVEKTKELEAATKDCSVKKKQLVSEAEAEVVVAPIPIPIIMDPFPKCNAKSALSEMTCFLCLFGRLQLQLRRSFRQRPKYSHRTLCFKTQSSDKKRRRQMPSQQIRKNKSMPRRQSRNRSSWLQKRGWVLLSFFFFFSDQSRSLVTL